MAEAFGSLLAEFNFSKASSSEMAPEAWVTYHNGTTAITVYQEIGSKPWVKIGRLETASGRAVEGEGYALTFVLSLRAPTRQEAPSRTSWERLVEIRDMLAEQAALVREYCADMLKGDFQLFPSLKTVAQQQLEGATGESEPRRGPA